MSIVIKRKKTKYLALLILLCGLCLYGQNTTVHAIGSPNPEQSGATGLTGKISSPPPTQGATISTPGSGQTFTQTPITVSGSCAGDVVVKVFSNNIFIGSSQCTNGRFTLQADLFSGDNTLIARVYDALDQAGPDSNAVSVNFKDSQFSEFNQRVSLTSNVAKAGAPVGTPLTWTVVLSGGSGPYAISVDWGDGVPADLKSVAFAGSVDLTHTYKTAGIYRVVVRATDSKGTVAFLQLVGVGSGKVTQNGSATQNGAAGTSAGGTTPETKYIWWPITLMVPIILAMFWVGRKYELSALRKRMEKQAQLYDQDQN
ncbi:MAG: hypothetical protein WBO35_06225 [Candidatus Saccharimonadales bacterium]